MISHRVILVGSIRTLLGVDALIVLYLAPPAPQSYCPGVSVSTVFCIYLFILLERNKRHHFHGAVQGLPTIWIVGVEKWSPRVPLSGVKWSLTVHACSSARLRTGLTR